MEQISFTPGITPPVEEQLQPLPPIPFNGLTDIVNSDQDRVVRAVLTRGVDLSEPFDLERYAFLIGQSHHLALAERAAENDKIAREAEKVIGDYYKGEEFLKRSRSPKQPAPKPVEAVTPPAAPTPVVPSEPAIVWLDSVKMLPRKIVALLIQEGPLTATQIRRTLRYYDVIPALWSLAHQKRIVREGRSRSRSGTWRALT